MRRFLSPRWVALHLLAVLAFCVCMFMAWWQLTRAQGGNALSWGYTFEWPVFGLFAVAFWVKLIRDERRKGRRAEDGTEDTGPRRITAPVLSGPPPERRGRRARKPAGDRLDDTDPAELAEYNRYLAWRNANPHLRRADYPG